MFYFKAQKTCYSNILGQTESFGCDGNDFECFYTKQGFTYGVSECVNEASPPDDAQINSNILYPDSEQSSSDAEDVSEPGSNSRSTLSPARGPTVAIGQASAVMTQPVSVAVQPRYVGHHSLYKDLVLFRAANPCLQPKPLDNEHLLSPRLFTGHILERSYPDSRDERVPNAQRRWSFLSRECRHRPWCSPRGIRPGIRGLFVSPILQT